MVNLFSKSNQIHRKSSIPLGKQKGIAETRFQINCPKFPWDFFEATI